MTEWSPGGKSIRLDTPLCTDFLHKKEVMADVPMTGEALHKSELE